MNRTPLVLAVTLLVAAGFGGCSASNDRAPTAPTTLDPSVSAGNGTIEPVVIKTPIAGTLDFMSQDAPGRTVRTLRDICHVWELPVHDYFAGDVEGPVTFLEQGHGPCDYSRLSGSGPFEADVVWNGRAGKISGQWTTNCKPEPSSAMGISCDGIMNARGSGGLEGVQFHFEWGPGFYPFPYRGTAFSK